MRHSSGERTKGGDDGKRTLDRTSSKIVTTPTHQLRFLEDDSGRTVDGDQHPVSKLLGRVAGSDHCRDPELPRPQRGVRHHASHVGYHRGGTREEGRPSWSGGLGDKDLARLKRVESLGSADNAHPASGEAGTAV